MKYFLMIFILLSIIALSAFADLTSDDLLKIAEIVKASEMEMKSEINASETEMKSEINASKTEMKSEINASETRMREYVDIKIGGIDTRITDTRNLSYALIAFIGVVIGIPIWRNRKDDRDLKKQVETLTAELQTLKERIDSL